MEENRMRILKTDFSKYHAVVAAAALITVCVGAGMAFGWIPYIPFGEFHGVAAASIFPLLFLLPLLFKRRVSMYKALRARFLITARDSWKKNKFALLAKITTWLLALTFLMQLITGALVGTGLGYQLFPSFAILSFHMSFLYTLGSLIVLHTAFQYLAAHRKPSVVRS
jgi:hypothetical protein